MAEGTWRGPTAPPLHGNVHTPRPRSELQANPVPPPCVQNAMMTKDKKPFTYTPGGIDLSEIRSPRMAKRIERNAQAQGVGEVPKSPNTYHAAGPLPPSAMAAMQTNMPVQVFPSGAPPPPPPPPPSPNHQQAAGRSIPPPPPPPPPQGPLPTKPVSTNEGVFDRPDMTRIIPENPMGLLRKTPKVERKTFLDELNDMERQNNRQAPPGQQQHHQSPPVRQNNNANPLYQSQTPQYVPQTQQYQVQSPSNNATTGISNQQRSQLGVLYIPPVTTSNGNSNSYELTSPPTPPIRSPQSPQSPQVQLNKAPRPWQNQKREEEKPTWAHRADRTSPPEENEPEYIAPPYKAPQQVHQQPEPPRRQQSQQAYHQQQPDYYSPQYQTQQAMYPTQGDANVILNEPPPVRPGVEVVWITQPQIMVHPGVPQQQQGNPQYQQQQQQQQMTKQQDGQGGRVIPIQVERDTPDRNLNRQQSWGPPTQSNSFKVLQKMTSTDGALEDEGPTTEHGPKTSQEFNQTPADQIRKMKLSQDDRELVHKFKQVPRGQQQSSTPHVRNIPIQIEGDDPPVPKVHPSQQSVPEPKKYSGGNTPGRSFKMLQSMTSPLGPDQSDL